MLQQVQRTATADRLLVPVPRTLPAVEGRVVVVDSDPAVRAVTARALRLMGFDTVTFPDAAGATDYLAANGHTVDCVLLDTGRDRYAHAAHEIMRESAPNLPLVLMSGLLVGDLAKTLGHDDFQVLQKPYGLADLSEVVARAIESRRPSAAA